MMAALKMAVGYPERIDILSGDELCGGHGEAFLDLVCSVCYIEVFHDSQEVSTEILGR
jgi:hypothetical protein